MKKAEVLIICDQVICMYNKMSAAQGDNVCICNDGPKFIQTETAEMQGIIIPIPKFRVCLNFV